VVVDDVLARTVDQPSSAEDVAALVRRQWTLAWFAELAAGSIAVLPLDNQPEIYLRYWQQRSARYLGESAWRFLMDLPAKLLDQGIRLAASSADETHRPEEAI